jgi:hypothetical protein
MISVRADVATKLLLLHTAASLTHACRHTLKRTNTVHPPAVLPVTPLSVPAPLAVATTVAVAVAAAVRRDLSYCSAAAVAPPLIYSSGSEASFSASVSGSAVRLTVKPPAAAALLLLLMLVFTAAVVAAPVDVCNQSYDTRR